MNWQPKFEQLTANLFEQFTDEVKASLTDDYFEECIQARCFEGLDALFDTFPDAETILDIEPDFAKQIMTFLAKGNDPIPFSIYLINRFPHISGYAKFEIWKILLLKLIKN
jgi:hypothetical protein